MTIGDIAADLLLLLGIIAIAVGLYFLAWPLAVVWGGVVCIVLSFLLGWSYGPGKRAP